jgi:hypothetical protein
VGRAEIQPELDRDAVQKVLAGRRDRHRFHLVPNATGRDERLVLRTASDASAGRDADRYDADRPGLCLEGVRDFHPSAWADAQESRFAQRRAPSQYVLLMAHLGLASLPEQLLPDVATREFPRDAWLALPDESESAQWEPNLLVPLALVSLLAPVSPLVLLALLRAQRW